jgi:hypothetical protein
MSRGEEKGGGKNEGLYTGPGRMGIINREGIGTMSIWESYPETYRSAEVQRLLAAVRAGECAAVIGLSGSGKSNLLGFMAHRVTGPGLPELVLADCNRLATPSAAAFLDLLGEMMGGGMAPTRQSLTDLETLIGARLASSAVGLCLLVDRFDALPGEAQRALSGQLRALRDAYKYSLTYILAIRRPLEPALEIAELFFAHTLWLGGLARPDAIWSAAQYAARSGLAWPEEVLEKLAEISGGYPSLLRACCEACAAGAAPNLESLRSHPAVQRRVDEFWRDAPTLEHLERSGLVGNALLGPAPAFSTPTGVETDTTSLTAAEFRLWAYMRAHAGQVCGKDELVQAVWPEEAQLEGLRDDSLAQLVSRLRRKVEPDPANPARIITVAGRGYRFVR